jgi:hypothetical protein
MTPEKWAQIVELFDTALQLGGGDVADFLARQSPDDPDLRGEVRRLLDHHEKAGDFLNERSLVFIFRGDWNRYRIVSLKPRRDG